MGGVVSGIQNLATTLFTSPSYARTPEEVAAYNASQANPVDELAKAAENVRINHLKASQPYFGTGNQTIDNIIDTIGGQGVRVGGTFGNGSAPNITGGSVGGLVNFGTMPNTTTPHTADEITRASLDAGKAYENPAPAPTDSQVNPQMGDAYKNQAGPPSVHYYQDGQTANGMTWSQYAGKWVSPAEYKAVQAQITLPASTTPPSGSATDNPNDLRVGDHKFYDGQMHTWNGVGYNVGYDASAPVNNQTGGGNYSGPPLPTQTPIAQVSTNTQNNLTTPAQWDAAKAKWDLDRQAYISAGLEVADAEARATKNNPIAAQPKPTNNPNNSHVSTGAPLVSAQNPDPQSGPTPSGAPLDAPTGNGTGTGNGTPPGTGGLSADTLATLAAMGINIAGISAGAKAQADAASEGAKVQAKAAQDALTQQQNQFETIRADQEPWKLAGTAALGELTNFDKNNPAFKFNNDDPSYMFRLDEGRKALENSAAARGGLLSGNTGKALTNYGQQAASQEYQNAYNRYQTTTNTKRNALQSLAGIGQTANQQVASAGQNFANNASNLICLLYTSPSPRDGATSRMPSSA